MISVGKFWIFFSAVFTAGMRSGMFTLRHVSKLAQLTIEDKTTREPSCDLSWPFTSQTSAKLTLPSLYIGDGGVAVCLQLHGKPSGFPDPRCWRSEELFQPLNFPTSGRSLVVWEGYIGDGHAGHDDDDDEGGDYGDDGGGGDINGWY